MLPEVSTPQKPANAIPLTLGVPTCRLLDGHIFGVPTCHLLYWHMFATRPKEVHLYSGTLLSLQACASFCAITNRAILALVATQHLHS